ncbi:DUF748 domain-containing protein [Shewanella surugensis]|uniref:DUF748 domain-containing protein n=1 Tax=Shewanella surugensis TaxID=212020 RepID=A0ABT0L877_9GAMM|nr:DUF748 domain-containing protein [Shewanella surugensis]MCL1123903.1 DUF748 domain-containing protein [Shewanella surugensis]
MPARSLTNKNGLEHRLKRKALYRLLLLFSLLYLLLSLSIGFILPHLLKSYAPAHLQTWLKRPTHITHISINPVNLHTQIDELSIQGQNGTDFIGFKRLDFTFQFWHSIFNQAIAISDVTLTEPFVNITRLSNSPNPTFNFSDILDNLATKNQIEGSPSGANSEDSASALPQLIANHISIKNAQAHFIDTINQRSLHYHDINLSLNALDSQIKIKDGNPEALNTYQIDLVGENGGKITTNGQLQLFPFDLKGQVIIEDLSLPLVWEVIADEFPAQLQQGQLDSRANYHLFSSQNQKNNNSAPFLHMYLNNAEISIKDLILSHEKTHFLSFPLMEIKGLDIDAHNKRINIKKLLSQSLNIHANINAQGLDIIEFITPHALNHPQSNKNNIHTEANWLINLNATQIEQAQLNITESLLSSPQLWQFANIHFATGPIDSSFSHPVDYSASFSINQHGDISAKGEINLQDLSSVSALNLSTLQLFQFKPYLDKYLNFDEIKGSLNAHGTLALNQQQQVHFKGNVKVNDFSLNAPKKARLISWKSITIPSLELNQETSKILIKEINIHQAKTNLIRMNDGLFNIDSLFNTPTMVSDNAIFIPDDKHDSTRHLINHRNTEHSQATSVNTASKSPTPVGSAQTTSPPTPKQAEKLNVKINQININEASSHFEDHALSPAFKSSITNINGTIKKINSHENPMAPFEFTANINHHAPITLKGEIAPFSTQPNTQFTLNIQQFPLPPISPYAGHYVGYDIDQGLMSMEASYHVKDQQLTGRNHVIIEQIALSNNSNSNSELSLPLPLAIALLEDSQGVITLDLPVSGDLNSPQFNITHLLNSTFIQLITKTISAPFRLLSSLLATEEALDSLYFEAANEQLSSKQTQVLSQLASGLRQRPKLTVAITHTDKQHLDKKALSEKQLHEKIANMTNIDLQGVNLTAITSYTDNPALSAALVQIYEQASNKEALLLKYLPAGENENSPIKEQKQQQWHQTLYNKSLELQILPQKAIHTLTQSRRQKVKDFLVKQGQITSNRISLANKQTLTPQAQLTVQLIVK